MEFHRAIVITYENILGANVGKPVVHSSYKEGTYNLQYPNGHIYKYPYKYSYNKLPAPPEGYQYIEEDELKRKFPTPRYVEIPSSKQMNSPGVEWELIFCLV